MLKFEQKFVDWINNHMIYFAFGFVLFTAIWIRMVGCDYVGNDYHFSLYDMPGNCHSILYRTLVKAMMERSDYIIILLKLFAYAGDLTVAALTMVFWYQRHQYLEVTPAFFLLTACLLSPVTLIYSMGGMRIDSLCLSLLLMGILCFRKGWFLPMTILTASAALLYPIYWPVVTGLSIWAVVRQKKDSHLTIHMAAAFVLMFCILILSVFIENRGINSGYFWGKIFVINPLTGESYAGPAQWLAGMCKLYGYCFATGSLLLAFRYKKMRLPALFLQLTVLLYVGWQQTSSLAI